LEGLEHATHPEVLVGFEHADDAAVIRLPGSNQLLLSTVDFFSPIVDNPYDFGREVMNILEERLGLAPLEEALSAPIETEKTNEKQLVSAS
jgi:hypothetical protein